MMKQLKPAAAPQVMICGEVVYQQYTRFCGYLKDCKTCPLQQQCMRNPPIKTGRQVQFINNESRKKLSYVDKMKVKIDSP